MPRRKTKRTTRKRRSEQDEQTSVNKKAELKAKLRAKLHQSKMSRQSQFALDNRMDQLEKQLENAKTREQRKKIREEMNLIDKIEEDRLNNNNDDFAEYGDNAAYGGGIEN